MLELNCKNFFILFGCMGCSAGTPLKKSSTATNHTGVLTDQNSDDPSISTSPLINPVGIYLKYESDLPACATSLLNKLAIIEANGNIHLCTAEGWVLKVNNSDQGDLQAEPGPQGSPGSSGRHGAFIHVQGPDQNLDENSGIVSIGDFNSITLSGNSDLNSIGTADIGKRILIAFNDSPWIKYSSSLLLSGQGDLKVNSGDQMEFVSLGSGSWREIFRDVQTDSLVHAAIANSTWSSATTTAATTVIFDQELNDTQSEFDNTTGVFTAKQSGTYEIAALLTNQPSLTWTSGNTFQGILYKNSTAVATVRQNAWSGGTRQISLRIRQTLRLVAGDQLRLEFSASRPGALSAQSANPSNYLIIARRS
jgi:hypothetical protein